MTDHLIVGPQMSARQQESVISPAPAAVWRIGECDCDDEKVHCPERVSAGDNLRASRYVGHDGLICRETASNQFATSSCARDDLNYPNAGIDSDKLDRIWQYGGMQGYGDSQVE